jgi:dienelactone hydrolase
MLNQLGGYGEWAAGLLPAVPRLSFRNPAFTDVAQWRTQARERFKAALLQPDGGPSPVVQTLAVEQADGLIVEHLRWQLPFGPPTTALLLRPAAQSGPLPGVLALYDHGGEKFFGVEKIAAGGAPAHPRMQRHRDWLYDGRAWANALARSGMVVLVHDVFAFGSRRLRLSEQSEPMRFGATDPDPDDEAAITAYNAACSAQESILAKALFSAGTTWPGVFTVEDQRALDVLCGRPEIDPARVGVCGFSGGGLRAAYLAGLDDRPAAFVIVGMLSGWRDFVLNKAHTHTWMVYPPGLPADLDYPDIVSIAAPKPILAINGRRDPLFSASAVAQAGDALASVYGKCGGAAQFRHSWHDAPHSFGKTLQNEAFTWLEAALAR